MSGGLFLDALRRETGFPLDDTMAERLKGCTPRRTCSARTRSCPLPGARDLLAHLHARSVPFAIATSGAQHTAGSALACSTCRPTCRS